MKTELDSRSLVEKEKWKQRDCVGNGLRWWWWWKRRRRRSLLRIVHTPVTIPHEEEAAATAEEEEEEEDSISDLVMKWRDNSR